MTTGNPLIDQGVLNRIKASVSVTNSPGLNVTAPYLGKEGITLSLDGDAALLINTMTGQVQSGEPYMPVTVSIHMLKTQGLATQYKSQMENTTNIGPIVVSPDSTTLPSYSIQNCAITNVGPMLLNGTDCEMVVSLKGYYVINNALFG